MNKKREMLSVPWVSLCHAPPSPWGPICTPLGQEVQAPLRGAVASGCDEVPRTGKTWLLRGPGHGDHGATAGSNRGGWPSLKQFI
jgi:hypothetical protein